MNRLDIYLHHLDHNYRIIKEQLHAATQLIGVVKASGYGGEVIPIAKRLVALGVNALAVAYTHEGSLLRSAGIRCPIIVFYPQKENLRALIKAELEPALYSQSLWNTFYKLVKDHDSSSYPIHIKYNTGLNRVGFSEDQCDWVIDQLKDSPFALKSVYSHLGATEDPRPSAICDRQIKRFIKIKEKHTKANKNTHFHLLNSSGIFNYNEFQMDAVRCGIALHGFANNSKWDKQLLPISILSSSISQIHSIKKGESVGYNNGWIAPRKSTIATLPIGHADGIGRHFGHHKGKVKINQTTAPIVGNVCMDMLMVDVTGIDCKEGDTVEIFGNSITARDFAEGGGSISYELLTGIGSRIPRFIHGE